jgi:cleavage and polyadenylation specificity factor subunit 2
LEALSETSNGVKSEILLQPPTSDEIASYFSLVHPLKYSQPHQPLPSPFSPPLGGLTVTAYNAGHTLGGTIWHIQHGLESIVYAVDWNQARENVLAGAAWLGGAGAGGAEVIEQLRRPTALICSSRGGEKAALPGGRSKRDELLLDMIKSAVSKGGIVLIPTDTSARVLELAYLLEHAWRTETQKDESALQNSKLYLASRNIGATMRYTRSMLEWMEEGIVREFEATAGGAKKQNETQNGQTASAGPFDFRHLRLLERKNQIEKILNETDSLGRSVGKVILASDTSLEWGFSKEVLKRISDDNRNLVILTERMGTLGINGSESGIGRILYSCWEERKDGLAVEQNSNGGNLEQVYAGGRVVEVREATKIALEGNDLSIYQQWLARQRQLQNMQAGGATALETSADVVDDASSDSSSESDDTETEQQGKALNISATMGHANRKKLALSDEDLGINILLRKKGVYDYDVRGKKGREKMFPLPIRRRRNDDFGDLIRPEDYLRAEERDELDGEDMRPGKFDKAALGQKRKWDEAGLTGDRKKGKTASKKQLNSRTDNRDSADAASITPGPEDEASDEDVEDEITGPSKVQVTVEKVSINFRIAFVDFSGLHDKRSLQMLIPLIQPRKLILVSGMKDETLALAADCRRLLAAQSGAVEEGAIDVYTPEVGYVVDASVDTNSWSVKLTDALVKRLRWQKVKGLGVVTLTGQLGIPQPRSDVDGEGSNKKQKLVKSEDSETGPEQALEASEAKAEVPVLDILPTTMVSATRSVAQPLHVGDLRLADLRRIMQTSGYTAEFRGEGTLLINGNVIVRKTGTGRIEVESVEVYSSAANMRQDRSTFYAVKNRIYEGLAVVAGG